MAFFQGIKDFLGIGRGSIDVQLKNYTISRGESVEGNVLLSLSKPVEAQGLSVQLLCNEITIHPPDKNGETNEQTEPIFNFTQPLDTAKSYQGDSSYPFKILIPADVYNKFQIPGVVGTLSKIADTFSRDAKRREWWLIARLSVKGIDTVKRIELNVV